MKKPVWSSWYGLYCYFFPLPLSIDEFDIIEDAALLMSEILELEETELFISLISYYLFELNDFTSSSERINNMYKADDIPTSSAIKINL